ncbi:MAG TPA: hypothetical protein VEN81_00440 [Planctomycetota bacterium]|nr:hypothetical protein [Planctomycetota bacterium]
MIGNPPLSSPPQTSISLPVQTAVWYCRATGAPVEDMGLHVSVAGSYRAPVLTNVAVWSSPPQTIISLPVQTAVAFLSPAGVPTVDVGIQSCA